MIHKQSEPVDGRRAGSANSGQYDSGQYPRNERTEITNGKRLLLIGTDPKPMQHRMSDSKVDLQLPLETRIAEMIDDLLPSDGEHELDGVPLADELSPKEFCNDSDMESDACEEMPPPLPFYNRDFQYAGSVSQRFHQSLPHVNGSRPRHNRMVGLLLEFHNHSTDRQLLQSRVDEFDTLLANL